jgi:hypothetical protein
MAAISDSLLTFTVPLGRVAAFIAAMLSLLFDGSIVIAQA